MAKKSLLTLPDDTFRYIAMTLQARRDKGEGVMFPNVAVAHIKESNAGA
jgi:hypothetical protein